RQIAPDQAAGVGDAGLVTRADVTPGGSAAAAVEPGDGVSAYVPDPGVGVDAQPGGGHPHADGVHLEAVERRFHPGAEVRVRGAVEVAAHPVRPRPGAAAPLGV